MFKMTSVAQSPAEKTSPGAPHSLQRLHGGGAPRAHSIRSRLTLIYHSVALLIVGMTWAGGMSYEFYRERVRVQQHLESQAVMPAANATAAITFSDAAAAGEVLSALRFLNTVRWAVILDADYQRLAAYGEMPPDLADWRQSLHGQAVAIDLDTIRVSQVISYDNKRVGTLLIEGSLDELNRHFLTTVSVSLLIIMLVVILGNRLFDRLSRAITDPINALIKVSRSVSETGDFRRRVEIRNRDELGQLSADFNGMLASLEDRENALRAELEERTRVQAKLDNLAHFDQVTNLPNRHYFSRRLQLAIEKSTNFSESVGLFFIDLDNFKYVNDTLGHQAGDRLLAEVGKRLSRALRANDVVARIGGDEFAVILEKPGEDTPQRIAAKIIESLHNPILLEGQEVVISASIGIAICPQDTSDQRTLVRYADAAMYSAKEAGKNRWAFYSEDMSVRNSQRLEMETQLRRGIAGGEFILFYQPIVHAVTQEVVSAEALVRWQHPERGIVSPAEFIALAEENGLIIPLGDTIFATACRQIRQWELSGIDVPRIAINVSGRQLEDPLFVSRLLTTMHEIGCSASQLSIELTESTLMTRHERIMSALEQLRAAGLSIAIDDFGTGYSSMAYLKNFPVSKLKIDRSFINDVTEDPQDMAITAAMIALGRGLNMHVVAEGVESAEQATLLRSLGCSSLQGYHFSRPLPAAEFLEFCAARRPVLTHTNVKTDVT